MVVLILSVAILACDRNVEPFQPGEEPSAPDLARIFPAPAGGIGSNESDASAQPVAAASGQPARAALPPSRAEAGATSQTAAVASEVAADVAPIQGEIDIAPEHAGSSPAGAILFIIARNAGVLRGPPLAVLRIADPSFPLVFSIGPDDVMIPSMTFAGPISLSARLDADGNAMTRGAGDISSPVGEPVSPGTTGVRLLLSEKS